MWEEWRVVTDVNLAQRQAQVGGDLLLEFRARLVLRLKVPLKDIALFFREARLPVACGRLWDFSFGMRGPTCFRRQAGQIHGRHTATSDRWQGKQWRPRRNSSSVLVQIRSTQRLTSLFAVDPISSPLQLWYSGLIWMRYKYIHVPVESNIESSGTRLYVLRFAQRAFEADQFDVVSSLSHVTRVSSLA
jgi:hypothetical protein